MSEPRLAVEEALSCPEILDRLARVGPAGISVLEDVTPGWMREFFAFKVLSRPRFNEWGRGTTQQAARIGALMERVERLSAFAAPKTVGTVTLTPSRCEKCVITLSELGLTNVQRFESFERTESQEANHFVRVNRVDGGAAAYAPASRVFLGYRAPVRDASCSTGLAAHFDLEEAIARGFLEVLERHVHHIIRFGNLKPGTAIGLEGDTGLSPALQRLIGQLHLCGFQTTVRSAAWTDELHCLVVHLDHASDEERRMPVGGRLHVAVHWDAMVAVERALTECLLSRVVARWHSQPARPRRPLETGSMKLSELDAKPPIDGTEAVKRVGNRLNVEVYWCDLTLRETAIPTVRVLIPGLQPNFELLGQGPLDPKARLTPHLTRFAEWVEQVRQGNFEHRRSAPPAHTIPRPAAAGNAIGLPAPQTDLALARAMVMRRTVRAVSGALNLREISTLLHLAVGPGTRRYLRPWGMVEQRNYPSAGGLHPLIFVVEARSCEDLRAGAYLYDHVSNQLSVIDLPRGVTPCRQTPQERALDPAVVIRMVRFGVRQHLKYGRASWRLCAIEAGHAGQNLLLLATELGINAVPLGNTASQLPVEISSDTKQRAEVIYSIAFGKPGARVETSLDLAG